MDGSSIHDIAINNALSAIPLVDTSLTPLATNRPISLQHLVCHIPFKHVAPCYIRQQSRVLSTYIRNCRQLCVLWCLCYDLIAMSFQHSYSWTFLLPRASLSMCARGGEGVPLFPYQSPSEGLHDLSSMVPSSPRHSLHPPSPLTVMLRGFLFLFWKDCMYFPSCGNNWLHAPPCFF